MENTKLQYKILNNIIKYLLGNIKINIKDMKDIKILLGQRIKELRRSLNISQQELAEMINIDQRNLSNIETGRSFPSKSLIDIASALNITLPELFEFEHISLSKTDMLNEIYKQLQNMDNDEIKFIYKFIKSMQ